MTKLPETRKYPFLATGRICRKYKTYPTNKEIDLYQLDKVTFQENEEIKDEYVPFTYEDYNLLMGKWIKQKNNKELLFIIRIYETNIGTYIGTITYKSLLKNYEFSNGDPCGKKVE